MASAGNSSTGCDARLVHFGLPPVRYDSPVIIDVHTHIFPSDVREERAPYLERDATFRELYARPEARVAAADELLASMDEAAVDVSVACGFAWSDEELCRRHNDALLDAASRSGGRIVPFCTVQASGPAALKEIERCAAAGARGLGELRPESQGYALAGEAGALLAEAARRHDLVLLFHASEPVGHLYPGKSGLPLYDLWRFIEAHPDVTVIAAHWGGGLPYFALMPEIELALANTYVDTAATQFLYRPEVYRLAQRWLGAERILFGSDFPLLSQSRALAELRDAGLNSAALELIQGGNAARLLRLE